MSEPKDNKQTLENIAVYNTMRTEEGRDFIWGHLTFCGVFSSSFDPDPVTHGYNAGLRDAGLQLERVIKSATPDLYIKMIGENTNG